MWKWTRRDENKSAPPIPNTVSPARSIPSRESVQTVPRLQSVESLGSDVSHIGKSIVIKGDVSGSGNVCLDGELEGSVELLDGVLTIGPEGRIRANLQARSIVVQGRVDGSQRRKIPTWIRDPETATRLSGSYPDNVGLVVVQPQPYGILLPQSCSARRLHCRCPSFLLRRSLYQDRT
jgi:hypothetical protein